MPEQELPSFDDPALKAALRRALGEEKSPDELRAAVERLFAKSPVADRTTESFAESPAGSSAPVRVHRLIWPAWGYAAAAAILLCIGLAAWQFERSGRSPTTIAALPESFAQALVVTHDYCCSRPDHHVLKGVPDDDFRLMTQKLREQLGFPALAAAAGDGWKFCGASAMCKVGGASSAHLVFKQNGESLSLFSLALSSESWPDGKRPAEGERFANTQSGHPIISWVHDDTVYCVVGCGPNNSLDLQGITPIADQMRVALSGNPAPALDRAAVALR